MRNERGEGNVIAVPFLVLIIAILLYIGVDVYGYIRTIQKVNSVCTETLEIMKAENGFDNTTRQFFDDLAIKHGLDPSIIQIQATPKLVQRGMVVEITARTTYAVHAFRPFGREITQDVRGHAVGLAQTFIR